MADQAPREERTEEATPRRRREARDEGQVAMSQELVSALMLATGGLSLFLGGQNLLDASGRVVAEAVDGLRTLGTAELEGRDAVALLSASVRRVLPALAALTLPLLAVGLVAGYGQIGFQLTAKAVAPKLSKVSPIKGFSRIFSRRSLVRFLMAVGKLAAIGGALVTVGWLQLPKLVRLGDTELGPGLLVGIDAVSKVALAAVLVILALSLFDLLFQRAQHERDLRMTKQEVKQDHKNTEGDPTIKARIRSAQRELARRRMMADVPGSTVVVTNPEHVAVALSYPREADGQPRYAAPRVVAKGLDAVAQAIKATARDAGVPLYEDVPLARTLHARCEIGDEIPTDLYEAVAAVLRFVYELEGTRAA